MVVSGEFQRTDGSVVPPPLPGLLNWLGNNSCNKLSTYLSIYLLIFLSAYLPSCLSTCLSIYLLIYLAAYLSAVTQFPLQKYSESMGCATVV